MNYCSSFKTNKEGLPDLEKRMPYSLFPFHSLSSGQL